MWWFSVWNRLFLIAVSGQVSAFTSFHEVRENLAPLKFFKTATFEIQDSLKSWENSLQIMEYSFSFDLTIFFGLF